MGADSTTDAEEAVVSTSTAGIINDPVKTDHIKGRPRSAHYAHMTVTRNKNAISSRNWTAEEARP